MRRPWYAVWLALGAVAVGPAAIGAQSPDGSRLQVYLMTMGAGDAIWERFGHNAIWVRDSVAHTDLIYNYGMFEFPEGIGDLLAFYGRFAMGRPRYWLGVDSSLQHTLAEYQSRRRDVSVQELNLTPAQRSDLAFRLGVNALPQNKVYTYDYFRDNCSTRVRDMLDTVLGGALARATRDRPGTGSFRFHTLRSITNDLLLYVGIDAAFGPRADIRADQWQEMFLPEKVQQHVRELHVRDASGRDVPLVKAEFPLLVIGAYHVESEPPHWLGRFALAGALIAALLVLAVLDGVPGVVGRLLASTWLLVTGLGGVLLLFFWLFTAQVATYANHNLYILSPLALGVLPSVWQRRAASVGRWRGRVLNLLALSVIVGLGLTVVPLVTHQDNLEIAALTVPPTLAALWGAALRLRSASAGRSDRG